MHYVSYSSVGYSGVFFFLKEFTVYGSSPLETRSTCTEVAANVKKKKDKKRFCTNPRAGARRWEGRSSDGVPRRRPEAAWRERESMAGTCKEVGPSACRVGGDGDGWMSGQIIRKFGRFDS